MGMINVKVARDHQNEFGAKYEKKKGEAYDAPAYAAQSLKAFGLVSYTDAKAAKTALLEAGLPTDADTDTPVSGN